jgi:hypothetical protein
VAAASNGPIKASPILSVANTAPPIKANVTADITSDKTAAQGDTAKGEPAPTASEDPSAKRGSLLPIRLAGQQGAARANQSNPAQGFVPLGVTTTETP